MTIADLNKRRSSLVRAVFEPKVKNADRFDLGLDEKEFAAIGFAVVHWSFLEDALQTVTIGFAEELKIAIPADAHQDSFRRRLSAYREVVAKVPNEISRKYSETLGDKISNANGFRQKLVHGIWSYKAADPDVLHVELPADGVNQFLKVDRIIEFAQEAGRLAMQLLHPNGYTIEDVAKERDGGPFFSREFLREIQKR